MARWSKDDAPYCCCVWVFSKPFFLILFEFLLTLGGLGRENIVLIVQWTRKMPSKASLCLREHDLTSECTCARLVWVARGSSYLGVHHSHQPPSARAIYFPSECCHRGRRKNLAAKSTGCCSRRPRFKSQHPHSSSQPWVPPVPGHLLASSHLCRHQRCMWYTDMHAGKTSPIHKKIKN